MRKMILSLGVSLLATTMIATSGSAYEPKKNANSNTTTNTVNNSDPAAAVYSQINFGGNKLSFEAFSKAYRGYTNLKKAGKLTGRDIISVADFTLASTANRLWVIDLAQKKV